MHACALPAVHVLDFEHVGGVGVHARADLVGFDGQDRVLVAEPGLVLGLGHDVERARPVYSAARARDGDLDALVLAEVAEDDIFGPQVKLLAAGRALQLFDP